MSGRGAGFIGHEHMESTMRVCVQLCRKWITNLPSSSYALGMVTGMVDTI
jgi:hypothetical protein